MEKEGQFFLQRAKDKIKCNSLHTMYFLIALVITLEDFVVHHEPVKFDHESELERRLKDSK